MTLSLTNNQISQRQRSVERVGRRVAFLSPTDADNDQEVPNNSTDHQPRPKHDAKRLPTGRLLPSILRVCRDIRVHFFLATRYCLTNAGFRCTPVAYELSHPTVNVRTMTSESFPVVFARSVMWCSAIAPLACVSDPVQALPFRKIVGNGSVEIGLSQWHTRKIPNHVMSTLVSRRSSNGHFRRISWFVRVDRKRSFVLLLHRVFQGLCFNSINLHLRNSAEFGRTRRGFEQLTKTPC